MNAKAKPSHKWPFFIATVADAYVVFSRPSVRSLLAVATEVGVADCGKLSAATSRVFATYPAITNHRRYYWSGKLLHTPLCLPASTAMLIPTVNSQLHCHITLSKTIL